MASNNQCGIVLTSCLLYTATAGVRYAVQVDGANGGSGPFELSVVYAPNNDFYAKYGEVAGHVVVGKS